MHYYVLKSSKDSINYVQIALPPRWCWRLLICLCRHSIDVHILGACPLISCCSSFRTSSTPQKTTITILLFILLFLILIVITSYCPCCKEGQRRQAHTTSGTMDSYFAHHILKCCRKYKNRTEQNWKFFLGEVD